MLGWEHFERLVTYLHEVVNGQPVPSGQPAIASP